MEDFKYDLSYTQNRELSWLEFDKRVLEVAEDENTPDLDKLKFISIFTSNLDEFFMVRVGSIFDLTRLKKEVIDNKTGLNSSQQLDLIYERMPSLYEERDLIFERVEETLRKYGIYNLKYSELNKGEKKYIDEYFEHYIEPVLSPMIINSRHPFPNLQNLALNIICDLVDTNGDDYTGIIVVPQRLPLFIFIPESNKYILIEEIILNMCDELFYEMEINDRAVVSITRNADLNLEEEIDDAEENFRQQMSKALKKRARLAPVRMEVQGKLSKTTINSILEKTELKRSQLYYSKAPLRMKYVYSLEDYIPSNLVTSISYRPYSPKIPYDIDMKRSIMDQIVEKDHLLHFPYESMDPFLELLKEASRDKSVISIKITIYRLASISKVAEYLAQASENGKDVTCLMELRARFDEENNIDWSERLEEAGCTIIYGFEDYKVHSKACLITRHLKGEISYITQLGTGNYNEKTAKQYTDFSLMTANQEIGEDVNNFFKNMMVSKLDGDYKHLLVAPTGIRPALLRLFDSEIEKAKKGLPAEVTVKCNSLTERTLIDKLAEASQAGVKIRLIIRGICCLLPGIEGKTENIEVISFVGRYLEHHRVFVFGELESEYSKIYISSADFMTRNISRRVEIAAPVYDPESREKIIQMLEFMIKDDSRIMKLNKDGSYSYMDPRGTFNAQEQLMNVATENSEKKRNDYYRKKVEQRILKNGDSLEELKNIENEVEKIRKDQVNKQGKIELGEKPKGQKANDDNYIKGDSSMEKGKSKKSPVKEKDRSFWQKIKDFFRIG